MDGMLEMTKEELRKLANGMHPKYVNEAWDCETVIVTLARFALTVGIMVELNSMAKEE